MAGGLRANDSVDPSGSDVAARSVRPPPKNDRYVEVNRRLTTLNGVGAAAISGLTVVAIWGHWRLIGIAIGIQPLVIAFNIWVNLVYLPRRGRSAEVLRAIVNLTTTVIVNRLTGWPLPVWLWLPFVALAFDHLDRRVAVWSLVGMCLVQDGAALLDGVSWIYPLSFTLGAVFCSEISRLRFSIIRGMLGQSDKQRLELEGAYALLRESHERLTAETGARREIEAALHQAQKMEAIGRLASGVAHEINTPVQFVSDSIHFLRDATKDLMGLIEKLRTVRRSVAQGAPSAQAASDAAEAEEAADLPYLFENVPKAFDRSLDGLGRVATIVRSMKEFAHPDSSEMSTVDLNHAIESTLIIARNEYKYVAEVETDFGELAPVTCHLGDINQVVLNIVVNAAHAIGDVVRGTNRKGLISVRTRQDGDHVVVAIGDTGGGIPEPIRERVFEPFFTTKQVGKGTGQGLAIAHSVVVDKHGGELSLESTVGKGTTFYVRLPVSGRKVRRNIVEVAA
jgi:signal transduction histidine kinase